MHKPSNQNKNSMIKNFNEWENRTSVNEAEGDLAKLGAKSGGKLLKRVAKGAEQLAQKATRLAKFSLMSEFIDFDKKVAGAIEKVFDGKKFKDLPDEVRSVLKDEGEELKRARKSAYDNELSKEYAEAAESTKKWIQKTKEIESFYHNKIKNLTDVVATEGKPLRTLEQMKEDLINNLVRGAKGEENLDEFIDSINKKLKEVAEHKATYGIKAKPIKGAVRTTSKFDAKEGAEQIINALENKEPEQVVNTVEGVASAAAAKGEASSSELATELKAGLNTGKNESAQELQANAAQTETRSMSIKAPSLASIAKGVKMVIKGLTRIALLYGAYSLYRYFFKGIEDSQEKQSGARGESTEEAKDALTKLLEEKSIPYSAEAGKVVKGFESEELPDDVDFDSKEKTTFLDIAASTFNALFKNPFSYYETYKELLNKRDTLGFVNRLETSLKEGDNPSTIHTLFAEIALNGTSNIGQFSCEGVSLSSSKNAEMLKKILGDTAQNKEKAGGEIEYGSAQICIEASKSFANLFGTFRTSVMTDKVKTDIKTLLEPGGQTSKIIISDEFTEEASKRCEVICSTSHFASACDLILSNVANTDKLPFENGYLSVNFMGTGDFNACIEGMKKMAGSYSFTGEDPKESKVLSKLFNIFSIEVNSALLQASGEIKQKSLLNKYLPKKDVASSTNYSIMRDVITLCAMNDFCEKLAVEGAKGPESSSKNESADVTLRRDVVRLQSLLQQSEKIIEGSSGVIPNGEFDEETSKSWNIIREKIGFDETDPDVKKIPEILKWMMAELDRNI